MPKFKSVCLYVRPWERDRQTDTHTEWWCQNYYIWPVGDAGVNIPILPIGILTFGSPKDEPAIQSCYSECSHVFDISWLLQAKFLSASPMQLMDPMLNVHSMLIFLTESYEEQENETCINLRKVPRALREGPNDNSLSYAIFKQPEVELYIRVPTKCLKGISRGLNG